jgi:hypothetical protein
MEFFREEEPPVGKGIFHFIPVVNGCGGAEDGADLRKGYLPDPLEDVHDLLLFVLQLQGIGQHLPAAAATNAEMSAKGFDPVGGILTKGGDKTFGPVFFVFRQLQVYDIAGDGILNEDDLTVHPGQGLAFRGIMLNQDIGQCDVLIFFSHGVKV